VEQKHRNTEINTKTQKHITKDKKQSFFASLFSMFFSKINFGKEGAVNIKYHCPLPHTKEYHGST
jgi:hypothetical protein